MSRPERLAPVARPAPSRSTWRDWSCTVGVSVDKPHDAGPASTIVRSLMEEVALAVSRFRADSDLTRCNVRAGRLTPVSALTCELVAAALNAASSSDGLVDPTLGRHLEAIGYDADIDDVKRRSEGPPRADASPGRVESSLSRPGRWTDVVVDTELRLVAVPRGHALDLGATAKAWAADHAAARVATAVVGRALVEIGGDVAVAGAEDDPFLVKVAEREGAAGEVVEVSSGGIATSSTTRRRWMQNGTEQHHLIDPRTGRCTRGNWRTATVWAPSCLQANILSTAALVRGGDAAAWLTSRGSPARLVDQQGRTTHTRGWPLTGRGTT